MMKNNILNSTMTYWGDSKDKTGQSFSFKPDQLTDVYYWT